MNYLMNQKQKRQTTMTAANRWNRILNNNKRWRAIKNAEIIITNERFFGTFHAIGFHFQHIITSFHLILMEAKRKKNIYYNNKTQ